MFSTTINEPVTDKVASDFTAVAETLTVFFVPYLLGFISASYNELRLWIALKKALPAPNPDELVTSPGQTRKSRGRKWHTVIATVALGILCILEFNLIIKSSSPEPIQRTLAILHGALYVGLFFITAGFIYNELGILKRVVHRKPDGGYLTRQHPCHSNKENAGFALLISLTSFLVILGLSTTGNIISVGLVTMAVVHAASASSFGRTTIRKMMQHYTYIVVTITALIFLQRFIDSNQIDHGSALRTSPTWTYVLFVPTALCSAFSGGLIARMLRYDYSRHLDDPNWDQDIDLTTVPAPTADNLFFKKGLVEGVLIPQRAPRAFLKPYFTVAIMTWSIIQATIIALNLGIGFPVSNPYFVCAMALLFEFPILVAVLSLFAAIRKENKALWNYNETWKLSLMEGPISL